MFIQKDGKRVVYRPFYVLSYKQIHPIPPKKSLLSLDFVEIFLLRYLTLPSPVTRYLIVVSASSPIGPRA